MRLDRFREATTHIQQFLASNKKNYDALTALAQCHQDFGDRNKAMRAIKQALACREGAIAYYVMSTLFLNEGKLEDSLKAAKKAVDLLVTDHDTLDAASIVWHYSLLLLGFRDFEQGWHLYNQRILRSAETLVTKRAFRLCTDEIPEGVPLLIDSEQGIGDEVAHLSCLNELITQLDNNIVLQVEDRLKLATARSFPNLEVISKTEINDEEISRKYAINYRFPLGSAPGIVRKTEQSFSNSHAFLKADPHLKKKWREQIDSIGAGLNIGISWAGGTKKVQSIRSIPLKSWHFLHHIDANIISLQYGKHDKELNSAQKTFGIEIKKYNEIDPLTDLENFFALISNLDLVISIDNSTVHFAGALGVETWAMLPRACYFYWSFTGTQSLWYPSVKLYRQSKQDNWKDVISNVGHDLHQRCKTH